MKPEILLNNGRYFDFVEPKQTAIDINTIAHALSHICRFTGHVRSFYSVAQHSILVSYVVPRGYELAGLLHDAPEAYIGDVAAPLKQLLPDYKAIEQRVEAAVFKKFGLPAELPVCVKHADLRALATELRDLMPDSPYLGEFEAQGIIPVKNHDITPLQPSIAKMLFLERYKQITQMQVEVAA
jgi:5'-deoxynucleotidase YfbR-like HD superfamily hydrolase